MRCFLSSLLFVSLGLASCGREPSGEGLVGQEPHELSNAKRRYTLVCPAGFPKARGDRAECKVVSNGATRSGFVLREVRARDVLDRGDLSENALLSLPEDGQGRRFRFLCPEEFPRYRSDKAVCDCESQGPGGIKVRRAELEAL